MAPSIRSRHAGVTLIEVLVTMLIMAFGLLGLAGLNSRTQLGELESYQRAQAIVLLEDMMQRMSTNTAQLLPPNNNPSAYVTTTPLGTNDTAPASCTGLAMGAARDRCEWSNALKGAAEQKALTKIGAMDGARGCIEELQKADATPGVCLPGIYRVSVVWQGLHQTVAPQVACGSGLYGTDTYRRAISGQVLAGHSGCQ